MGGREGLGRLDELAGVEHARVGGGIRHATNKRQGRGVRPTRHTQSEMNGNIGGAARLLTMPHDISLKQIPPMHQETFVNMVRSSIESRKVLDSCILIPFP